MTQNQKKQKEEQEEVVYDNEVKKSSFSGDNTQKLKKKIKILEEERKEYLDGWQRSRAELVNLQKQHNEEKKIFTKIGKKALLEQIIPVIDNFDAAFSNKEAWEKTPVEWRSGIEYIYNQFIKILEDNDVVQYGKEFDDFDEAMHCSVENIPTEDKEKIGKILKIVQSGYMLDGKIVREAKVKVFVKK